MSTFKDLLIINIAGLGRTSLGDVTPNLSLLAREGAISAVQPAVPALTTTSQATLLTGTLPCEHGMVANGWYFRELASILNWQRTARLVKGTPIWESLPDTVKCANLFWRNSTHASCALKITERPTYWVDGRKTPDVYTEPDEVRDLLVNKLGPFPLFKFWGPLAGIESTRWIVDATIHTINTRRFGVVLTYLPHLDYDHQRFGPESLQGKMALQDVDAEAGRLLHIARDREMDVAIVSDYAFEAVSNPVYLNRVLREKGLLAVQHAENGELLEPGASRAFAVCDQQIAHIYVSRPDDVEPTRELLVEQEGVDRVLDRREMESLGIAHERGGELLAIASADCWFAYHYWLDEKNAPDFAPCVAIHVKPGFDPTELLLTPGVTGKLHLARRMVQKNLGQRIPFDVINTDSAAIRGSHGRIPTSDAQRPVLITSWTRETGELVPMQAVRAILLQRACHVEGG
jgi:predicted AlkP superfamily pyrophosphatase or phosphodiesterase